MDGILIIRKHENRTNYNVQSLGDGSWQEIFERAISEKSDSGYNSIG